MSIHPSKELSYAKLRIFHRFQWKIYWIMIMFVFLFNPSKAMRSKDYIKLSEIAYSENETLKHINQIQVFPMIVF